MTTVIGGVATMQAGFGTPLARAETAVAGYTFNTGQQRAQELGERIQPGLSWLSILNSRSTAWNQQCSPLYAIAPMVLPLLPIIVITIAVAFVRFFIWLLGWLLKMADIIVQILQVIRG